MGRVHILHHVAGFQVEVVHIENHVEILDGISGWYTPGCRYSKKGVINLC